MTECNICCEKYTKSVRKSIKCIYCNHEACKTCIQRYMLDINEDPHCMYCRKAWNREFVDTMLTKTFRNNGLKKHREEILLDRERGLLPATQHLAERIREKEKMLDECRPLDAEIILLQKKIKELKIKRENIVIKFNAKQKPIKDEKKTFIRNCPVEDCRGFLSSQWKCGLCDTWTCPKCHEIKGDTKDAEHTCKEENVKTAELLAKDTKSCPGCGVLIFKIIGCPQMWCVNCHTPFDWKTRNIIKHGVIHNPHYFEWQRQQHGRVPRMPGDNPCGGINISSFLGQLCGKIDKSIQVNVRNIVRYKNHIKDFEMRRYHNQFNIEDNSDLRVRFLLNGISEELWKKTLQKREKKHEKEKEIHQVLEMLVNTTDDGIRIVTTKNDEKIKKKIDVFVNEISQLIEFANTSLEVISKRFSCMVPLIKENMRCDTKKKY